MKFQSLVFLNLCNRNIISNYIEIITLKRSISEYVQSNKI